MWRPQFLLWAFSSGAWGQQNPDLAYICDEKSNWVFVASLAATDDIKSQRELGRKIEEIATWSLIMVSPEDKKGNVLRTGSRVTSRNCGRFLVRISGGYLNSSPLGELGAIQFPIVEISVEDKLLLPRTALSVCDSSISKYSAWGACPTSWAISVSALWQSPSQQSSTRSQALIHLRRSYDELRSVP